MKRKAFLIMLYLCMTIAAAAILELGVLLFGHLVGMHIPVAVTLGLLLGVIAFSASKIQRLMRE